MKLTTACVPCLLKRVEYEVDLCRKERTMHALAACSRIVSRKASHSISSAEFASEVHRCAYRIIGKKDPYIELKRKSNLAALSLIGQGRQFVRSSTHPLRAAMKLSIIGNLLDFGISGSLESPKQLKDEFRRMLRQDIGWDDSEKIERLLRRSREVVYLADNCGEIVFDGILIEEIKKLGVKVVLVVKGEPILTDVTRKDLRGLGIEKSVDQIVETEGIAVGLNLWDRNVNVDLKKRMRSTDLIISKGMANFEAMSEHEWKAVAYLMRTKCEPVSNALRVKKDANIIKLVKGRLK
ncbi:MAG: ARMT1-like domain-containing protein [Thermoplasmata archaeon]